MSELPKDGRVGRRVSRLWRVLVVGGAILGAACATTGKGKDGKDGGASKPASGAAEPGGAQSW